MIETSNSGIISGQEASQLEQSLQEIQLGRLGALAVMMQPDHGIQEELQHDLLYASDSLADLRVAQETHLRVTDLVEAAANRQEGMRG